MTKRIAIALFCTWAFSTHVYQSFDAVRLRLVTAPLPAQHVVSVPLLGAEGIEQPLAVIVCRLRNNGDAPATITAVLDNADASGLNPHTELGTISIPAGSSTRADLTWTSMARSPGAEVIFTGTDDRWTIESLEVANIHGFNRGPIEFLVLPAKQAFATFPPWTIVASFVLVFWLTDARPRLSPVWLDRTATALAVAVGSVFVLASLSDLVSPYRIVLSLRTVLLCVALLSVPMICEAALRVRRSVPDRVTQPAVAIPWSVAIMLGGFVGYALLIWLHVGAYAAGSDSSGYFNSARLLDDGRATTWIRRVPDLPPDVLPVSAYQPLGFRFISADAMAPTYPIGLPLTLAGIARVIGWNAAPNVTMLLYTLMGVALTFALARACGLSRYLAALAALMLASSPLYLFSSLQFMSDVPALVWTTLAVTCAWRSRTHSPVEAAIAGIALSAAVLVRPTNALALLPIAVCLGGSWKRWVWLVAGGVPGAAVLLGYNHVAYGQALTSGYGDIRVELATANVLPTLQNYAVWLPVLLTPLAILALGLPFLVARARLVALMLWLWMGVFAGFYVFYSYSHLGWPWVRFLLPAFPAIITAALLVGAAAVERWRAAVPAALRGRAAVATAIVALMVLAHNNSWVRQLGVLNVGRNERVSYDAATWVNEHLPRESAVLALQASGSLFYYTAFPVIRYDALDDGQLRRLETAALEREVPIYAVLFPLERESFAAALADTAIGHWSQIGEVGEATIWRFDN